MSGCRRLPGRSGPVPPSCGIGLRAEHYEAVLGQRPAVGFLEVHSENYFGAGGRPLEVLESLRRDYPVSLHGVGLSLGSADPLDTGHLARLKALADCIEPVWVSEHLSWSSIGGRHFHGLLPLPYTEETLAHLRARIALAQDRLGRRLLIENPATYLQFECSSIPEAEFLVAVARASGCGILLDVNNVYVSSVNHGFDAVAYLEALPAGLVEEIHLAGHRRRNFDGVELLIDSHDCPVAAEVWDLYARAAARFPAAPALIEWDSELPPLEALVAEARQADRVREGLPCARAA